MASALQIWSHVFCRRFDALSPTVQQAVARKVDEVGERLDSWPHQRLSGRAEFKLRVGDYRVLYEFDLTAGRLHLLSVRHRSEIYRTRE